MKKIESVGQKFNNRNPRYIAYLLYTDKQESEVKLK